MLKNVTLLLRQKTSNFFNIFSHFLKKISHTPTIVDNIENSYDEHVSSTVDDMESSHNELRRSKRQRKEISFGNDFILI